MLNVNSLKTYKNQTNPSSATSIQTKKPDSTMDDGLKGFLLNTRIKKKQDNTDFSNFDEISSRLLIPENYTDNSTKKERKEVELFDIKKAMKPLLIAGGIIVGAALGVTYTVRKYSGAMAHDAGIVHPPALSSNNNLNQETYASFYEALRDPSAPKIRGLIGVGVMSVATIAGKKFIDAVKEIWTKKQNCDIEHDLQENLINVETEVFSGKLNVTNTLLKDTTEYFKNVLSENSSKNTNFKSYLSFKGKEKNKNNDDVKLSKKNILYLAGIITGLVGLSFILFKNVSKIHGNLDQFQRRFSDNEIRTSINKIVEASQQKTVEASQQTKIKENAIINLSNIFKSIKISEDNMKEEFKRIKGITPDEITSAIDEVKKVKIFAVANEMLYGEENHQHYYCYMDELRGHFYNYLLHPENKFNQYLFLGLSAITTTGYVIKAAADAIKDVTVNKQNAKSELNLRKNLISTEIENFKAKKLSAVNPLIDNFNYQMKKGKSKEELKELAENILSEIKNGPPYVYA